MRSALHELGERGDRAVVLPDAPERFPSQNETSRASEAGARDASAVHAATASSCRPSA